jgi:hypothetical protein
MPLEIAIFHSSMTVGADDIRPYGAFTSRYFGTSAYEILRCAQDDKGVCGCVQTHLANAAGGGVPDAPRIPWLPLEGKLPRSGCGM